MKVKYSDKIEAIPEYLFAEIDALVEKKSAQGVDVIKLSVGDPDLPTPANIVEKLGQASKDPSTHQYPSYLGMIEFRQSVSRWYRNRFNVSLDAANEVIALLGSKEGIAHLPRALLNPAELALVPDPGYPIYRSASLLAGASVESLPLDEAHGFLPEIAAIPKETAYRAKLLFLNYPNNPTGAVADLDFFRNVADWAVKHQVWVAHDSAYADLAFQSPHPSNLRIISKGIKSA